MIKQTRRCPADSSARRRAQTKVIELLDTYPDLEDRKWYREEDAIILDELEQGKSDDQRHNNIAKWKSRMDNVESASRWVRDKPTLDSAKYTRVVVHPQLVANGLRSKFNELWSLQPHARDSA